MRDRSAGTLRAHVPFRVRVGVTGHRTLPDDEALARRVAEVLDTTLSQLFDQRARNLLTSTPGTPVALTVVTPLAEGADRLVAREVLKRSGSAMHAVLPFAKHEYAKDFITAESKQEFDRLIHRAERVTVLGDGRARRGPEEKHPAAARHRAYEDAGRYVVDNCDVMVALWDGRPSEKQGGTAATIRYAEATGCPLIIISTVRPYEVRVESGRRLSADTLQGIEDFNSFSVAEATTEGRVDGAYSEAFESDGGADIPAEERSRIRENLLPFYVRASAIAEHNQRIHNFAGISVYCSALLALSAVALGTLWPEAAPYAFLLEFFLLLYVLFTVVIADRRRTHSRWVQNRFLAERIRTSVFFNACGLDVSPVRVPAHLASEGVGNSWMLAAFDEIWRGVSHASVGEPVSAAAGTAFVRNAWIQDQIRYHTKKAKDSHASSRRLELAGITVFAMAVAAPAAHLALFRPGLGLDAKWLEAVLTFTALLLPALGSTFEGVRSHQEYSRLAKRSASMADALTEIDRRFEFVDTRDQLEVLMRDAEELVLVEAADWLALMHFAKVEPIA